MAGPPRFSVVLSGLLRTCLQLAFGLAWPPLPAACARAAPVSPACSLRPDPSGLSACSPRPAAPVPLLTILPLAVLLLPTPAKFSDGNFELLDFCSALCRGRSP